MVGLRPRAEGERRNHRSRAGDTIEERAVGCRIIDVDTGTDERDGRSARVECGQMRYGVDARRPAGNDDRPRGHEFLYETLGDGFSVRTRLPWSYDGQGERGFRQSSADVEEERMPGERLKRVRVVGFVGTENARSDVLEARRNA